MLENPPFVQPGSDNTRGGKAFFIKDIYVCQQMLLHKNQNNIQYGSKAVADEMANFFIWSAFHYYLTKPHDSYVLFAPIKYWKSHHLVDKKVNDAFLCNRIHFKASEGGIALIHWQNEPFNQNKIVFKTELRDMYVDGKKILHNINTLFNKKKVDLINYDCVIDSKQGRPEFPPRGIDKWGLWSNAGPPN